MLQTTDVYMSMSLRLLQKRKLQITLCHQYQGIFDMTEMDQKFGQ